MAEMFVMVGIISKRIVYLARKEVLAIIKTRRMHFVHHMFP